MNKKILGCILISFIAWQKITAQDVTASSSLDKNSYQIGDYIHLNIDVKSPAAYFIYWPVPQMIASFDVISSSPVDTIQGPDIKEYRQEIIYSIYDSGRYTIPQLNIVYKKPKDTVKYTAFADSIPFFVHTVAVDTTLAIKPIKAPIQVTVKNYTWLYIVIGCLILIVILYGLYLTFFKKAKKSTRAPRHTPETIFDHAMKRLKELDEKKLWQKDEIKQYYIELTDILREYMEFRFKMKAMESTSDEIIEQLMQARVNTDEINHINYILELADLAKFAKSRPLANDNAQAMSLSYQFLEITKPAETEQTGTKNGNTKK